MIKVEKNTRFISEMKKKVNKLVLESDEKNILIVPSLNLETILNKKQKEHRIFLNQLVSMTTNMSEIKGLKFCIVVSYGKIRLSKEEEKKIQNIVQQLLHQLDYTTVALVISTSREQGKIFIDNVNSNHLIVDTIDTIDFSDETIWKKISDKT